MSQFGGCQCSGGDIFGDSFLLLDGEHGMLVSHSLICHPQHPKILSDILKGKQIMVLIC